MYTHQTETESWQKTKGRVRDGPAKEIRRERWSAASGKELLRLGSHGMQAKPAMYRSYWLFCQS